MHNLTVWFLEHQQLVFTILGAFIGWLATFIWIGWKYEGWEKLIYKAALIQASVVVTIVVTLVYVFFHFVLKYW